MSGSGSSRGSESEEEEGGVLEKLIDGSFEEDPIVELARNTLVTTKTSARLDRTKTPRIYVDIHGLTDDDREAPRKINGEFPLLIFVHAHIVN